MMNCLNESNQAQILRRWAVGIKGGTFLFWSWCMLTLDLKWWFCAMVIEMNKDGNPMAKCCKRGKAFQ